MICILELKLWPKRYNKKKKKKKPVNNLKKRLNWLSPIGRKGVALGNSFPLGNKFSPKSKLLNIWPKSSWQKCCSNPTFFIPLEIFQNIDILNDFSFLIWNYDLKVMMKRKVLKLKKWVNWFFPWGWREISPFKDKGTNFPWRVISPLGTRFQIFDQQFLGANYVQIKCVLYY
jgi:hypothetical protein